MKKTQYTIRNISERMDQRLRETAAQYGSSLNQTALDALSRGLNLEHDTQIHHDLDDLIGTWIADPEFDRAVEALNRVDKELWM